MSTEQQWDIVSGVGMTALMVAAARAVEASRPEALVQDPYASSLVRAAHPPVPMPTTQEEAADGGATARMWETLRVNLAVRTHAFDTFLKRAADEGVDQVVLLASGLDTRPFRLPWRDGVTCFEIDQPAVLDFKSGVLREHGAEAGCDHRQLPMDLREAWAPALENAGLDRSRPTAWLAEGLLSYLPLEAETRLLDDIRRLSAPGSHLAVECIHDMAGLLTDAVVTQGMKAIGIDVPHLVDTEARPAPEARLTELGWRTESVPALHAAAEHGHLLDEESFMGRITHLYARLP